MEPRRIIIILRVNIVQLIIPEFNHPCDFEEIVLDGSGTISGKSRLCHAALPETRKPPFAIWYPEKTFSNPGGLVKVPGNLGKSI